MKAAVAPARTAIQINNILFATDFSPAAVAALPFAAQLAREFGAKLYAVHAKAPENYALPATEIWPVASEQLEKETADFQRTLDDDFPDIMSEVIIMEGGVTGVVDHIAATKNADLIVLGTHGRRGIGKFILGSVAEEILRHAPCPVLTVGPRVSTGQPRGKKFRKILFATDFSEGAATTFAFAVGLAQEQQAHLTLLHVIEKPKTGDLVQPHEIEQFALDHLISFVKDEPGLVSEPRTVIVHGAPGEKIVEVAEREQADLIVLGLKDSKGYIRATHLPMAVAHRVISQATCPVLTVRA
ncbi:MAG TPA: universal stress protein [Candidatus Acidoferrum sp.]|nr:universal stress protein [Candidatus Acidoferrum sp.]